jgi:hypothetical protein
MNVHVSESHIYRDRGDRCPRIPSDRFTRLLKDVSVKHGSELETASLMRGSQFSYLELCALALSEKPIPAGTDVLIFTSCTSEFDPKQPGIGASFIARFGFYDLHAICNEGILGGFTALHLAQRIVKHQNRNVRLIALEQNTNPLPKNYVGFIPTENIVGQLDLRAGSPGGSWQIISAGVVHPRGLRKKLEDLTTLHDLSPENLTLHLNDQKRFADFFNHELNECHQKIHTHAASSAQFVQSLAEIMESPSSTPFAMLLLADVFSENCGFLLVKVGTP